MADQVTPPTPAAALAALIRRADLYDPRKEVWAQLLVDALAAAGWQLTRRDEGLRAALGRWQEEYAEIEEFTGDDGSVERFMTQLNHGNDEYDLRLEVIRQARAALASGEEGQ